MSGFGQTYTVSIPSLSLKNGERITGFEFHVQSGRIACLPNVPIGWNIQIDNDPSWNTSISGSFEVGAAALYPTYFKDFLFIEKEKDAPLDLPFDLHGEVIVTSDFIKERKLSLKMQNFSIVRTQAHASPRK